MLLALALAAIAWLYTDSSAQAGWSAPYALATCAAFTAPQIAFPSASPTDPTGAGAIVWLESSDGCAGGSHSGAQDSPSLLVAWLGRDDRVTVTRRERLGTDLGANVLATGANMGRVAVAVAGQKGGAAVLQGHAPQRPTTATTLAQRSGTLALTRAYLGDVAVASVQAGPAIVVHVERFYRDSFGRPLRIPIAPGPISSLTLAMDYRSDVLVTWQQDGSIYAHMLRASGRPEPTQRVGASAPSPQLQALVSDDNRGVIAWSSSDVSRSSRPLTTVHLALAGTGVRFGGQRVIASFPDPDAEGRQPGSLGLVRLGDENVMLAWTAVVGGRYAVLAAPVTFTGLRPAVRLTPPADQAVLAALAPSFGGDATALWRRAGRNGSQLWATPTFIGGGDRLGAGAPEPVGQADAGVAPVLAVDPANGRA
ncbi:MAG TPA: hypothetical protein VED41_03650, partial [Solirubrobacteraceae bacterium]|nr:hypothetical protein [Solirubrobacteraceae bacterium]